MQDKSIDLKIKRSALRGEVQAPASKSYAHRALIAAFLAGGDIDVDGGDDVAATKRCVEAIRTPENADGEGYITLDAGESGSTLRFLLPIVCALGIKARFVGRGRLGKRPVDGLIKALEGHGCKFSREGEDSLPLRTEGKLNFGKYEVDGSVSSQYVTGLLMALPLLGGESTLKVEGKSASASYIDMTLSTLEKFGISVRKDGEKFIIPASCKYVMPKNFDVEGDWSSAGFLLVAGALAGEVRVRGLLENSAQGDKIVVKLLKDAGADITLEKGAYISKKSNLRAICFDAGNCPDVVPVMATALSFADGVSRITSVERLRDKESDRLGATISLVNSFGAEASYDGAALIIKGRRAHAAGEYPAFNDHRMAMSAIVAALATDGECRVRGAECIDKSYVNFISDMKALGADISAE